MPRFAILIHDHPVLHWDFLLEQGEVLRAWRLLREPHAGAVIPAEPLPDHRRIYLDYEGPVSGNRGTVTQWDAGTFEVLAEAPGRLRVKLAGRRIHAIAELSQETGCAELTLRRAEGDAVGGEVPHGESEE